MATSKRGGTDKTEQWPNRAKVGPEQRQKKQNRLCGQTRVFYPTAWPPVKTETARFATTERKTMTKTSSPPSIETPGPRHSLPTTTNDFGRSANDFSPSQIMAALDILSRRQMARVHRLSSISRLRGAQ